MVVYHRDFSFRAAFIFIHTVLFLILKHALRYTGRIKRVKRMTRARESRVRYTNHVSISIECI